MLARSSGETRARSLVPNKGTFISFQFSKFPSNFSDFPLATKMVKKSANWVQSFSRDTISNKKQRFDKINDNTSSSGR